MTPAWARGTARSPRAAGSTQAPPAGARELARRALTTAVGLPVVAALIAAGPLPSAGLFGLAGALAVFEYYRLVLAPLGMPGWIGVAAAATLPLLPVLAPAQAPAAMGAALLAFAMLAWIHHVLVGPRADAHVRVGHLLAGLLFAAGGLVALSALRAGPAGLTFTVATLLASFGNDTGAYLIGRKLGRTKLLPAVSPGKTWEGLVGGAAVAFAALLLLHLWLGPGFDRRDCLVLSAISTVLGPLGDLSKSMIKRAHAVKDFGRLLPGHGGMLDRIDALIFNAPAVLAYRLLVG